MQIGENLRKHRLLRGLKQEELCAGVCSVSQYSKIETGKAHAQDSQIKTFAGRLGLTVSNLLNLDSYEICLSEKLAMAKRVLSTKQFEKALSMTKDLIEEVRNSEYVSLYVEAVYFEARVNGLLFRWQDVIGSLSHLLNSGTPLPTNRIVEILGELGTAYMHDGDMEEALRCYARAYQLMPVVPDDTAWALTIAFRLARQNYQLRNFPESFRLAEQSHRLATKANLHIWRMRAKALMAMAAFYSGKKALGYQLVIENVKEAEENMLIADIGGNATNLGCMYLEDGDLINARHFFERGANHMELLDNEYKFFLIEPYLELAMIAVQEGNERRAQTYLDQVQELMETVDGATYLYSARIDKVRATKATKLGDFDLQLQCLQKAHTIYLKHKVFWEAYLTAIEIAELMVQIHHVDAVEYYRLAIKHYHRFENIINV